MKKIKLKKEIIATVSNNEMNSLKGGGSDHFCTEAFGTCAVGTCAVCGPKPTPTPVPDLLSLALCEPVPCNTSWLPEVIITPAP